MRPRDPDGQSVIGLRKNLPYKAVAVGFSQGPGPDANGRAFRSINICR